MRRPVKDMDFKLVQSLLSRVRPKLVVFHVFGEPLLYPNVVEAVQYATSLGVSSMLDTNGQLLGEDLFVRLCEAGLGRLVFSFGAVTKEVYESIWRGCNFDTVSRNIRKAYLLKRGRGFGTNVTIRPIVTRENRHQLSSIEEVWRPFCDTFEVVNEFHLYGYDRIPLVRLDRPDCKQLHSLYRNCVIRANGDMDLCCFDSDGDFVVGNVLERDIMDLWRGEVFESFRRRIYKDKDFPSICLECPVCPK